MEAALSTRVLVLNRLWQAVNIVGAKRAFCLLFQEHACVIHTDDDSFQVFSPEDWLDYSRQNPPEDDLTCVHTVHEAIRIPKILLLRQYDRVPVKEVKFSRQNVFERDDYTCQYCGRHYHEGELNLDHVIPRDRGGRTTWENIVTSCVHCNTRKANRVPHEASMHLRRKPHRPKWRPFVTFAADGIEHPSWGHFLKVAGG